MKRKTPQNRYGTLPQQLKGILAAMGKPSMEVFMTEQPDDHVVELCVTITKGENQVAKHTAFYPLDDMELADNCIDELLKNLIAGAFNYKDPTISPKIINLFGED